MLAQCLLHRDFAALQQCCIAAGADDLAGGLQIRCKILNDGRVGPDGAPFVRDIFTIAVTREPLMAGEQPDIDAEFVEYIEADLRRGRWDQMLLDRI